MFVTVKYFGGVDGEKNQEKRGALWNTNIDDGDWRVKVLIKMHYYLIVC